MTFPDEGHEARLRFQAYITINALMTYLLFPPSTLTVAFAYTHSHSCALSHASG